MSSLPPRLDLFWKRTTSCSVTSTEQRRGLFPNVLLISTELQLHSHAAQLPCVMLQSPACNAGILTVGCGQSEPRELWQPAALSAAIKMKKWRKEKKKALKHKSLLGWGDIRRVLHRHRHVKVTVYCAPITFQHAPQPNYLTQLNIYYPETKPEWGCELFQMDFSSGVVVKCPDSWLRLIFISHLKAISEA